MLNEQLIGCHDSDTFDTFDTYSLSPVWFLFLSPSFEFSLFRIFSPFSLSLFLSLNLPVLHFLSLVTQVILRSLPSGVFLSPSPSFSPLFIRERERGRERKRRRKRERGKKIEKSNDYFFSPWLSLSGQ